MALLMALTANYVNRYAHQMGQSLIRSDRNGKQILLGHSFQFDRIDLPSIYPAPQFTNAFLVIHFLNNDMKLQVDSLGPVLTKNVF